MICSQCNKEFIPTDGRQKYCSKECANDAQKERVKKNQQTDSYIAYKEKYRKYFTHHRTEKPKELNLFWKLLRN